VARQRGRGDPGGAIETERLSLQRWDHAHAEMLVRLSSIAPVVRHVGSGATWPRAKAHGVSAAQVEHWRRHGFGWRAAVEKSSNRPIGFIALNFAGDGTAGLDPWEYEIGWWLDPAAWGRGFAREGARAVRDEAYESLGAPSLVARIQPANGPSIAVAMAIGLGLDYRTTGAAGEPVAVYRAVLQNNSSSV
jgi:RimJ/RimL family protein N-acetyltransferase